MLLRAAIGGGGAERRWRGRLYRFGMLAAAVRLGVDRVEPRQRVRAPGAAQPAGRRPERSAPDVSRDSRTLHTNRFDAVSDGRLAVLANLGANRRDGDAV